MQKVPSNYETDLFLPLTQRITMITGRPYDPGPGGVSHRVLADHARAVVFLLSDGAYPSNEGRGYVLRRILRRGLRHAYLLGHQHPIFGDLADVVLEEFGEAYPELQANTAHIKSTTRAEEERFLDTIEGGLRRLDELTQSGTGIVSGGDAFKLYDTYGFPFDLTELIARERGHTVDGAGFRAELERQRDRSRKAGNVVAKPRAHEAKGDGQAPTVHVSGPAVRQGRKGKWISVRPRLRQRWVGYETTRAETEILKFRRSDDRLEIVLRENPFYAASGGQISDTGVLAGEGWTLEVTDVEKVNGRNAVIAPPGEFEATRVLAQVDEPRRANIERNHSATHLVHAALHRVLGRHARQAGSVVAADRLRFDFTHHGPVTHEEMLAIEAEVNSHIWENLPVETRQMAYREALEAGAMALFGEKYGDRVRVVDIPDVSLELCGGTHVDSTGKIGFLRLTSETGVAAGVRRVEAVTGPGAYSAVRQLDEQMQTAVGILRAQPEHLSRRIETLVEQNKKLERQLTELLRSGSTAESTGADEKVIGDVTLVIDTALTEDRQQIALMMDAFREKRRRAISVLFAEGERPGIHVALTDDLVASGLRAGDIANAIAEVSGGRGGGRPHFASAGAGDPTKLADAKREAPAVVERLLGS
jgi:alanyl-tRNA synthetase